MPRNYEEYERSEEMAEIGRFTQQSLKAILDALGFI